MRSFQFILLLITQRQDLRMAKRGYQGFGSFHSDNVEEMIRAVPRNDVALPEPLRERLRQIAASFPSIPLWVFDADLPSEDALCGAEASPPLAGLEDDSNSVDRGLFLLENETIFLNHGAFGAAASPLLELAQIWRLHAERQPLRFIDRELLPLLVRATREIASFLGIEEEKHRNVVLLPNVTTGLNAVIRGFPLGPDDCVLSLDIGYGAVKKMLQQRCQDTGAEWIELKVHVPFTSDQLVLQVKEFLDSHPRPVRLAVFDHITSNSACVLPIRDLIALCHSDRLLSHSLALTHQHDGAKI